MFTNSNSNKRYYTLDYFYKRKFGCKVAKVSLNAGFTCPNIDGTKGCGGCIYCSNSGSGEFGGNPNENLLTQFNNIKKVMDRKWENCKYIAYFQAHTNTYAPVSVLKEKYELFLNKEDVGGISIATRCDAINDECLNYLEELSKKTYLTIELGLQTIHESTSKLINRGHTLEEFDEMVKKLKEKNINVVVHIINGLPNETKEMMIETANHVNDLGVDGIKIHMLAILKNTMLERYYKENPFHVLTKKEYIEITCEQIQYLNENMVINRITSDPDIKDLIEPIWLPNKRQLLNDIDKYMKENNIYQGQKAKIHQ